MKNELEGFLKKFGAYKMGVADPKHGFKMARNGCHPRDIMKNCNSVVVFALHVGLDYYTSFDYCQTGDVESRVLNIYRDWISYNLANFLRNKGYDTVVPHGFKDEKEKLARLSFKLAAYEAGLGVFGRPSILITPEYGPKVNFGVVLTDASIAPDKPLENFSPCQKCDSCARVCPVNAISNELPPPKGFDRNRCVQFVYQVREKTKREIMLCGFCYNRCPMGGVLKKTFHLSKWRTLHDLGEQETRKLLQRLNIDRNVV